MQGSWRSPAQQALQLPRQQQQQQQQVAQQLQRLRPGRTASARPPWPTYRAWKLPRQLPPDPRQPQRPLRPLLLLARRQQAGLAPKGQLPRSCLLQLDLPQQQQPGRLGTAAIATPCLRCVLPALMDAALQQAPVAVCCQRDSSMTGMHHRHAARKGTLNRTPPATYLTHAPCCAVHAQVCAHCCGQEASRAAGAAAGGSQAGLGCCWAQRQQPPRPGVHPAGHSGADCMLRDLSAVLLSSLDGKSLARVVCAQAAQR